jgi:hypothetical protein
VYANYFFFSLFYISTTFAQCVSSIFETGVFASRGPWEDYSIDLTNEVRNGVDLAKSSGMWRSVIVNQQYPYQMQDSRLSVSELCELDPHTPGDDTYGEYFKRRRTCNIVFVMYLLYSKITQTSLCFNPIKYIF